MLIVLSNIQTSIFKFCFVKPYIIILSLFYKMSIYKKCVVLHFKIEIPEAKSWTNHQITKSLKC